ncbi:unnamed protein product, partial [marine sediment metagenome]
GGPHEPWDAPGEYATMYDPAETPPPIVPVEARSWVPDGVAEWERSARRTDMSEDDVRRLRANYYGKISLIDHWVGEIFAACESKRIMDDLLVVFWSDHGEMAGDHQLLHKSRFFESALRVPLMLRWPGNIRAGRTSSALVETVDIMPTVLEAVAGRLPPSCQGESLWPVLRRPSTKLREAVLSEVGHQGRRNMMIRTERCKYAVHEDGQPYMLYNLVRDPGEQTNLLGHPKAQEIERQMRERLFRLAGKTGLKATGG